jgi:hypothetical protein
MAWTFARAWRTGETLVCINTYGEKYVEAVILAAVIILGAVAIIKWRF